MFTDNIFEITQLLCRYYGAACSLRTKVKTIGICSLRNVIFPPFQGFLLLKMEALSQSSLMKSIFDTNTTNNKAKDSNKHQYTFKHYKESQTICSVVLIRIPEACIEKK